MKCLECSYCGYNMVIGMYVCHNYGHEIDEDSEPCEEVVE